MNAKKGDMLIMIRRKILFALILVLSFTASAWGATATFEVGTGKEFTTIQEALYSADVLCASEDTEIEVSISSPITLPGVIRFSGSESDYNTYVYSNIKTITITGGTLTAASSVRHFKIDSSNADVTFNGVTFVGGSGGIEISTGTLNITGGSFTNCSEATGGAINVTGGSVTVDGVTFTDNEATNGNGGAIYVNGGTLTLKGTKNTFDSNTASANGGAICIDSGTAKFEVENDFTGNTADTDGGAIYSTVSLNFTGAQTFTDNTTTNGNGGAIYTTGTTATFGGAVTFTGNTATNGSGGAVYTSGALVFNGTSESKFDTNTAKSYGGAIYATSSKSGANFSAASVTFNKNEAGIGGAVHSAGTLSFSDEATFTSNTATSSDAGAIYTTGTLTFSDTATFTSNTAKSNAGAIYVAGGTTTFSDTTTFKSNAAINGGAIYVASSGKIEGKSESLTFEGNTSSAYIPADDDDYDESDLPSGCGGAIYTVGTVTFESDMNFNDNAAPSGGAIYVAGGSTIFNGTASFGTNVANEAYDGGALYLVGGSTTFNDIATFTANKALNAGGAIYAGSIGKNGLLFNEAATFTSNQANTDKGIIGNGGAIHWGARAGYFDSVFTVSVVFSGNSTDSQTTANDAASNGGALYFAFRLLNDQVTIDAANIFTFDNNVAYNSGGAIYAASADILITGANITVKNEATTGGGGFAAAISGKITVDDSSFSNQVAFNGGVLYAEKMEITSSDFSKNQSTASDSGYGGGAVFAFYEGTSGKLEMSKVTFSYNTSNADGGAVFANTANVDIEYVFFDHNTATLNGGAMNIGGTSKTGIKYATFSDNDGNYGGALYAKGTVAIDLSYFTNNYSDKQGGAIHYDQRNNNGDFRLTSSMLIGNSSLGGSGGAAYIGSDIAQVNNCTFDGNKAEGDSEPRGGAVYMNISSTNNEDDGLICNSTFTRNIVQNGTTNSCGGAIAVAGSAVTIKSCAVTLSNTATTYGAGIYIDDNAKLYISGTLAVGNNASIGGDLYRGNGASIASNNYNRIGIYGTGGRNTGFKADANGRQYDRENTSWTNKDFYQDNDLDVNAVDDTKPPYIGSSWGTDQVRLLTIMLNELESMAIEDRATNNIQWLDRFKFTQYDERGVDRYAAQTNLDIGPVMFSGTVPGGDGNTNLNYSIASIKISGIPNSMKAIGETASLLAVIRYTNGRSAFAGNGTNQEKVTWRSSDENIIKFTGDGVITAMGKEGTAYITVTTQRTKQDGTYASDRQAVTVTPKESILNLGTDFLKNFEKFLEQTYEYDMSVAMADPNTSVISSAAFQSTFKNKWGTSPSAILDMSKVYPDFSLKKASAYKANTTLYLAAAQAQRPGINVNFPERTDGDLLPLTYSWTLKGADIKYLLGEDYQLGDADAKLAADLFSVMSINLTTANNKNINVVNADNAGTLFSSKALVLSKADSNNGVHIDLTAYIAHVDGGTGTQIVNNLLIVPDNLDYDEILDGTMWLAYGTSSSNNNNNNNKGGNNNSDGNSDSNSNSGGGGGGGGCNSLALGLIAAGLLFALKRK